MPFSMGREKALQRKWLEGGRGQGSSSPSSTQGASWGHYGNLDTTGTPPLAALVIFYIFLISFYISLLSREIYSLG